MELNQALSDERINEYRKAGLTDSQIRLLRTPFSQMGPGEAQQAFMARDKWERNA